MAVKREILEIPSKMTAEEFWDLVGHDESTLIEFKEQLPKPSRLQDPLVAFSNHRGGAVLVGVSSTRPHEVLGTSWTQEHEERVQDMSRSTQPPMRVDISSTTVNGARVVFLQVEGLEKGWGQTSDGRVLVRAGPTNRALIGMELFRFLRDRASDPVEEDSIKDSAISDLDAKLARRYIETRLPGRRPATKRALADLGFLDDKGNLRLATLLAFGKHPQKHNRRFGVEVLRFEGSITGKPQLRDRAELEGPLPKLVEAADRRVYEEMRRDAVVRGLVREEVPEFPPVVVREALVNALVHRDYGARGAAVQVRIFDDALEVESPGTLPAYISVENLREAQYSRNPKIMDVMQRLRFVEEAGQGIDRMYAEMEDALLSPPEFEERSSSFLVRLRGTSVFAAEDRLWVGRFASLDLSADAKVAIVYARRHGGITNEDLRNLRGLDRDTSRRVLQDLVARGLLQAVGRGRGARYVLGDFARRQRSGRTIDNQLKVILKHARRQGSIVNSDVRGLLDVDRVTARELLYELVARGLLRPEGERRGRKYLPRSSGRDDNGSALASRGAALSLFDE
jgi:ATP-dependent DNA helicase RecG